MTDKNREIEEIRKDLIEIFDEEYDKRRLITADFTAEALYNAGYRKQNDEELIDKIATYFEKEDNWTKLKYAWNISGKSAQLRNMLRDAITEAKMKGGE